MLARELADALRAPLAGDPDRPIDGIEYDSRNVTPGALFVALRGEKADGHSYLQQAVDSGASALLVQDSVPASFSDFVPVITVPDTRPAMAIAASAIYNHPSRDLTVFAVTGTNGKTSTTHLIDAVLTAAGIPAGIIGTLGAKIGDRRVPIAHTTPESSDLQQLLASMRDDGVRAVAMETSSHAIAQNRVDSTEVDAAVFTNLTQDHLDFHQTMEAYFQVKAELFTRFAQETSKPFCSVINIDDPVGREKLVPIACGEVVTYGIAPDAHVHAEDPRSGPGGSCFRLVSPRGSVKIALRLGGFFNIHNALAAAAACLAKGIPLDAVQKGLESVGSVPGRFERVECGQSFAVVVDYAHTPDGLENVLSSARRLNPRRLITVFGCGGDRDRTKRPIMGEIASRLSDVCILTSDNPRSEDPEAIACDVLQGVSQSGGAKVVIDLDRRSAIRQACALAGEGDMVVVAGKGHETYQIFADRTIDFDDRQVVREALAEIGAASTEACL